MSAFHLEISRPMFRSVCCRTSIYTNIRTLQHCWLTTSLLMRWWSCRRSRSWSAGSTIISRSRHANDRCPTSRLTSRILLCTFIFWIRLLQRMPALPRTPRMYVGCLLHCHLRSTQGQPRSLIFVAIERVYETEWLLVFRSNLGPILHHFGDTVA